MRLLPVTSNYAESYGAVISSVLVESKSSGGDLRERLETGYLEIVLEGSFFGYFEGLDGEVVRVLSSAIPVRLLIYLILSMNYF